MKIKMAGIDHSKAVLSKREAFVFSKTEAQDAMQRVIETYGVSGCVIVSTCNRTEIWISEDDNKATDLPEVLCALKNICLEDYVDLITKREKIEAVRHLFATACGLNSQIWGEDQILSQIKASIESAREVRTTNEILEKLFQTAITSAKKIKSTVRLTPYNVSTATKAMEAAKQYFPSFKDLKCLVVGNGEMGRLVSSMLVELGAQVTMTLRKYKHKLSIVPQGCVAVDYEKRIAKISQAELIISSTSSPHYTIKYEDVSPILADSKRRVFIDLAVPRDISPQITQMANVILLDIESMGGFTYNESSNKALSKANEIIDNYIIDFLKWFKIREILPLINTKGFNSTESISSKLKQELKKLNMEEQKEYFLEEKVLSVITKAIPNILYKFGEPL